MARLLSVLETGFTLGQLLARFHHSTWELLPPPPEHFPTRACERARRSGWAGTDDVLESVHLSKLISSHPLISLLPHTHLGLGVHTTMRLNSQASALTRPSTRFSSAAGRLNLSR
jgi:hypothetical protein